MPKLTTPAIYLAGGMENAKNLGAGWRNEITPALVNMGFAILDPCKFEPQQLKGLKTSVLPKTVMGADGKEMTPTHWHQLKYTDRRSSSYKRFKNYMQRIINYDLRVLTEEVDIVVCNWTESTAKGAGTHSELTWAFKLGLPVYLVLEPGTDLPGWAHGCCTQIFDNFQDLLRVLEEEHT